MFNKASLVVLYKYIHFHKRIHDLVLFLQIQLKRTKCVNDLNNKILYEIIYSVFAKYNVVSASFVNFVHHRNAFSFELGRVRILRRIAFALSLE